MQPNDRIFEWAVWKFALPVFLLGLLWPVYWWVMEVDHPFARAFAAGDLLIIAALVLIEVGFEGDAVRRPTSWIRVGRALAKFISIVLFVVFGFVRYDSVVQERRLAGQSLTGDELSVAVEKLDSIAMFNVSIAACALAVGFLSFCACAAAQGREQLEAISRGLPGEA